MKAEQHFTVEASIMTEYHNIVSCFICQLYFSGDWRLYIRQLALFFELDKILPYSFLGLLTDRQLYDMLQCADVDEVMQLPVDGVIACARYHAGHCYQVRGTKL